MTTAERARSIDAIVAASAVVLVSILIIGVFRRELYSYSPAAYWALDVINFVAIPCVAMLVLANVYGIRPVHYGLRGVASHETWDQFLGLTLFLAVVLNLVYYAGFYVSWLALRTEMTTSFYKEINPPGLARIPVTIYLGATAGLVEEIFVRGLPLLLLNKIYPEKLPRKSYVLGTATIFSALHWTNGIPEAVATFCFGVAAAVLYLRLRDLWPLIASHFAIDIWGFW